MVNGNETTIAKPNSLCLRFSAATRAKAQQDYRHYSSNPVAWNAYLARLSLDTFIPWLQEVIDEPAKPDRDSPKFREFLPGAALECGQTKIVLIPSETSQQPAFFVPQEWVDIPELTADYYLAVQVNLEEEEEGCWMEVWGYATHWQLKKYGEYHAAQRAYSISRNALVEDIVMMLLARELAGSRKMAIQPLPALTRQRAEELLSYLGNPNLTFPRLAVPFAEWGALLENEEWRSRLYQLRISQSIEEQLSVQERLLGILGAGWQTIEEIFANSIQPDFAYGQRKRRYTSNVLGEQDVNLGKDSDNKDTDDIPQAIPALVELLRVRKDKGARLPAIELLGQIAKGNPEASAALSEITNTAEERELRRAAAVSLSKIDPENPRAAVRRGKTIDLGIEFDGNPVALVATLMPEANGETNVQLRVYPTGNESCLPINLQMLVLDETGAIFQEANARSADNWIQLEFTGESGDVCTVKLVLGKAIFSEEIIL